MHSAPLPQPAAFPARGVTHTHEIANALTHGVGTAVALCGAAVLIIITASQGDRWRLAGAIAFSASLVLLYAASTLYHSARDPVAKSRLKILDHCAIYLLIAGTYTPFTLVALRGPWGWGLFATVWSLALAGVGFKLLYTGRFRKASTGIYIAMGWIALVAIGPLVRALDPQTLGWLVGGGVAYTVGTIFYLGRSAFSHAIWHLFCLAGSGSHYIAVMRHLTSV